MIYFNGDSNVAGAELASLDQGMAAHLAQRLGQEYINHAFSGASNDRIYDTTMSWLLDQTQSRPTLRRRPDLVVIGWTQFNRIQWFLTDQWDSGQFWEINLIGVGIPLPEQFQARYEFWKQHIEKDGIWKTVMSNYWHNKIYNLHCLLDYFNIPHLFFNAFDNFSTENIEPAQQDWNSRFMSPYDPSQIYTLWCARNGYQEITPGFLHFDADAHRAWADVMHDHLIRNQIL